MIGTPPFAYQSVVASRISVGAIVAVLSSVTALARAEAARPLDYEVAPGCPDERHFLAAVAERGGNFSSDHAPSIIVRVAKSDPFFAGSLAVNSAGVASQAREVHGATCQEVVNALAVVTAIALNPKAGAATPAVPIPAVTAPSPSAPLPALAPKTLARRPPLHAVTTLGRKTLAVEAGEVRLDYRFDVAGLGGAVFGLVPSHVMPRIDATLARANFVTLPDGESHLLGTVARFRWSFLVNQSFRQGDTAFDLGGQQLGLGLCASPHYHEDGLVLLGCAELALGLLQLKVREPGMAERTTNSGFAQLGFSADAKYHLGRHFLLAATLGIDTLSNRFEANRADGSRIFQSSVVMGSGMLGLGATF